MSARLIGMNSRIACVIAQIPADLKQGSDFGLDSEVGNGSLTSVADARSPAVPTFCLVRHLSPVGRSCAEMRGPPKFFSRSKPWTGWRLNADPGPALCDRFDTGRGLPCCTLDQTVCTRRDAGSCRAMKQKQEYSLRLFSGWLSWPVSGWPPAATRCPNRPCWAAVPGRSRGPWWAAVSSPARPSGRRATSSIVRPIRGVADDLIPAPRIARTDAIPAIAALGSGGLFHVKSQTGQARAHARPRLA